MRFFKPFVNFAFILFLKVLTKVKVQFSANIAPDLFIYLLREKRNDLNLRDVLIGRGVKLEDGISCFHRPEIFGDVKIGRYTSISGPATRISSAKNPIRIGSFCSIASSVVIQEYFHNVRRATTYNIFSNIFNDNQEPNQTISKGPIVIEDDVWIGSNVVILSGVTIGRGAIVGAGSIVTKDVDRYSVVGGNPAAFIKSRFSKETINLLEDSKWWEWPIGEILQKRYFFTQERI